MFTWNPFQYLAVYNLCVLSHQLQRTESFHPLVVGSMNNVFNTTANHFNGHFILVHIFLGYPIQCELFPKLRSFDLLTDVE